MTTTDFDVAVVGAGPAGLFTGLALAHAGLRTAVVAPRADAQPARTTALLDSSLEIARRLDLAERLEAIGEPLRVMRLIDDTGALVRAPEVSFRSSEIGLDAFGLNIANDDLVETLEQAVEESAAERIVAAVETIEDDGSRKSLTFGDGTLLTARLAVGADGRSSMTRESAGIGTRTWSLPQTAVVLVFEHALEHENISTEFHRPAGPFTVVPLRDRKSSLVWVEKPRRASELMELPRDELAREIENGLHRLLGKVRVIEGPFAYPLSTRVAKRFGGNRTALVGEAAHAFAPIGAQGLNLGFRDVADLAKTVGGAHRRGEDIGSEEVLKRFDRARHPDVWSRTLGVEALNRSLTSRLPALPLLRGAVLSAADRIHPLRRLLMREGVAGAGSFSSRL